MSKLSRKVNVAECARQYQQAGLNVLPIAENKKPSVSWKRFQSEIVQLGELPQLFPPTVGIAIVCGAVSGGAECLDFDAEEAGEMWVEYMRQQAPDLLARLSIVRTPRPGLHVWYRLDGMVVPGNQKITVDGAGKTIVETRGEGGYALVPGGHPGAHPSGRAYELIAGPPLTDLAAITPAERELMHNVARRLGTTGSPHEDSPEGSRAPSAAHHGNGEPWWKEIERDFEARTTWADILEPHGWKHDRDSSGLTHWTRPGKDGGTSATTGVRDTGNDLLRIFSSNSVPFEDGKSYGKFRAFATLNHGGSMARAAENLRQLGYGRQTPKPGVDLSRLEVKLGKGCEQKPPADGKLRIQPCSLIELVERCPSLREPRIHGLLRRGETMNIVASSKTGKSWLVGDLVLSVASGMPWLEFNVEQGRVLVLDNELHSETIAFRFREIIRAKGLDLYDVGPLIDVESLRGNLCDLSALEALFFSMEPDKYQLVVLDAAYRFNVTSDENSNAEMAQFYNLLDQFASRTGACFAVIHHASKGNQSGKSITDVGSGAGSQSRAADTHLVIREHEQPGAVVLDGVTRSWPSPEPRCLRWGYPLWCVDANLDPADLKGLPKRREARSDDDSEPTPVKIKWDTATFREHFLGPVPVTRAEIMQAAEDAGLAERKAIRYLQLCEQQELVYRWGGGRGKPALFSTLPQQEKPEESTDGAQSTSQENPPQSEESRA